MPQHVARVHDAIQLEVDVDMICLLLLLLLPISIRLSSMTTLVMVS